MSGSFSVRDLLLPCDDIRSLGRVPQAPREVALHLGLIGDRPQRPPDREIIVGEFLLEIVQAIHHDVEEAIPVPRGHLVALVQVEDCGGVERFCVGVAGRPSTR